MQQEFLKIAHKQSQVLLGLAQDQNKILMTGIKERIGDWPGAHAITDMLRRSVDTRSSCGISQRWPT
jgi:hypothetical protein